MMAIPLEAMGSFDPADTMRDKSNQDALDTTCRRYLDSALRWSPVFEDGRGGNDMNFADTLDLLCKRLVKALSTTEDRAMDSGQTRKGLEAAIRAAKLALFVIRKQGVMPNSSWEAGFEKDLKLAEDALAVSNGERA